MLCIHTGKHVTTLLAFQSSARVSVLVLAAGALVVSSTAAAAAPAATKAATTKAAAAKPAQPAAILTLQKLAC
jgi:hypothetical protein